MLNRDLSVMGLLILSTAIGVGCARPAIQTSSNQPARDLQDKDAPPAPLHVEEIRARAGDFYPYPAGTLVETKSYYVNAAGKRVLHGPNVQFYENGKIRLEVPYRDGQIDGLLVEYSPFSGEKEREEQFRKGRHEGLSVEWHSPGRKASQCTYHNDRIVGSRLYWNAINGALSFRETYDANGDLAEVTAWYDNGQLEKRGRFKGVWPDVWGGPQIAGRRDGRWTYWDQGGKVTAEGDWKDGKPWEGTCIVPRRSGSLFVGEKAVYHDGKVVGPVSKQMLF